jgi:hypothetical protein
MAYSPSIATIDPRHIVNLKHGKYDSTTYADLDTLFTALEESGSEVLVVHFHGGNVPKKNGLAEADRLQPEYERAGAFPVFFIWESGPLEIDPGPMPVALARYASVISEDPVFMLTRDAILRTLGAVREEHLDGRPITPLTEAELRERLGRLIEGQEPLFPEFEDLFARDEITAERIEILRPGLTDALRELLSRDARWLAQMQRLVEERYSPDEIELQRRNLNIDANPRLPERPPRVSRSTRLTPVRGELPGADFDAFDRAVNHASRIDAGAASHWLIVLDADVAWEVIKRFSRHRDHGLYCTVLEEVFRKLFINGLAWVYAKIMEGAHRAFEPDPTVYGGTGFLTKLDAYRQTHPDLRVVLIGHSGGGVYIHELLRAAVHMHLDKPFDVVFLAGAATYENMQDAIGDACDIVPHFRAFGLFDERESGHNVCGKPHSLCDFYPRSLLYFVGGVCEPHADELIVGMQRHQLNGPKYTNNEERQRATVHAFFKDRDAAVWAPTTGGADGRRSGATTHENLPEDPDTLDSLRYILKQGF